jgi:hypothetical protein
VFPARYELNSYVVFRKRLVSKRLNATDTCHHSVQNVLYSRVISNHRKLEYRIDSFILFINGYEILCVVLREEHKLKTSNGRRYLDLREMAQ